MLPALSSFSPFPTTANEREKIDTLSSFSSSSWIRSFDLFRHRHVATVSWGVHDLFFLEVRS
jgi:hypothetical protein